MKRRTCKESLKKVKITLELDEEMINSIEKIATLKKISQKKKTRQQIRPHKLDEFV